MPDVVEEVLNPHMQSDEVSGQETLAQTPPSEEIETKSDSHVSVMIVTCRPDQGRYTVFDDYLGRMMRPPGAVTLQLRSPSIAASRNVAVEAALDRKAEYLFFLDDDHAFAPDILWRLALRKQQIISATYLTRSWPFHVVAYDKWLPDEEGQLGGPKASHVVLTPKAYGVRRVVATGCGGLLINTKVFANLEKPYFKLVYNEPDQIAEDFAFFRQVYEKYIPVHLDLDCIMGHITPMTVWPWREDGEKTRQWLTVLTNGGERIPIPSALDLLRMKGEETQERLIVTPQEAVQEAKGLIL